MKSPKTSKKSAVPAAPRRPAKLKGSARPDFRGSKKSILQQKKAKNRGGRPRAISESKVRKLEEAFKYDFTIEEALDHAEVRKSTYYDLLKSDKRFSDRMRRAQAFPLTLSKKTVLKQIEGTEEKPGDGSLALRLLERRQPERYRTKIETDLPPPIPPMTLILPGAVPHPRFTPVPAAEPPPKEKK